MGSGFWRTVQMAIEEDSRTVRFIAILLTMGAMGLCAYLLGSR
ncbi:hypothetical protein P8605_11360 [Streptomyces sp. T-3]|nr:hypothetical protein [Streptomyces sp. T-3]